MWQSFAAIGRETAEISRWIKKEKKEKKETAAKHKGRGYVNATGAALVNCYCRKCRVRPYSDNSMAQKATLM